MIEARGAKNPYAVTYIGVSSSQTGNQLMTRISHTHGFLVADSDDEAVGKALKISYIVYPSDRGWEYRDFHVIPLGGIGWISEPDLSKIEPRTP